MAAKIGSNGRQQSRKQFSMKEEVTGSTNKPGRKCLQRDSSSWA